MKTSASSLAQVVSITEGERPLPRFGHTMVAVNKTKVVLFGGATGDSGRYTITGDTFVLDLAARRWKLLNASTGVPPGPTAAHAACAIDAGRMVVYGGATGGRSLAADDIYLLDIRDAEGSWGVLSVVGQTPGRRYGHTLSFLRPHLVLFGGNTGNEPASDAWFVNIERTPLQWQRIDVAGDIPPPRVYHAAAVCVYGTANGMLIIFGGRTTDQSALNDTWGLRKHRDGRWDWLKAPYRPGRVVPLPRYQHTVLFVGSHLTVLGGRTNNITEPVPIDVYDTESSEWTRAEPLRRFRHASWNIDSDVYVHGGFAQDAPNLPTDNLFKLDILRVIRPTSTPEPRPLPESRGGYEPSRPLQAVPRPNNRTPDIRLANQVFVSLGIDKKTDDPAEMVKKVSLDRLQDEGKRINATPKPPGMSKYRPMDSPCDIILNELLKPKDWQLLTNYVFGVNKELLIALVTEVTEIMQKEPVLMQLRAPVKVYGSLHGQFLDLLRLFEMWGAPNDIPGEGDIESFDYVFLGNYVDMGTRSLELICLLFALKVKYPDQVVLLRGVHEDRTVNLHRGFAEECRVKMEEDPQSPKSLYNLINQAFEMMPLAAVIEDKFLCVHSGIGSTLKMIGELDTVRKPVVLVRSSEDIGVQLALELMLSEPSEKDTGVSVSSSRDGAIIKFGISRLRRFLADNSLISIIRGHDTVAEGLETHWNGELQTLISATDYAGQYKNAGAVLIVKKSCAQTHKLISPLPDVLQGCWLQQTRPVTPVRRGLRS